MVMKITSSLTLNRQKRALLRSLKDLRTGKRTGHLSKMEVDEMIVAIEKRLINVDEGLNEASKRTLSTA